MRYSERRERKPNVFEAQSTHENRSCFLCFDCLLPILQDLLCITLSGFKLCSRLGYLAAFDHIRSEKRTAIRERSSKKSVSFEEQTLSKDK